MKRVHGTYLSLSYVASGTGSGVPKYTCAVSKKVAAKAVERNLIKRRCREAVKRALSLKRSAVLVFSAKSPAKDASVTAMQTEVESLLHKAHLS